MLISLVFVAKNEIHGDIIFPVNKGNYYKNYHMLKR